MISIVDADPTLYPVINSLAHRTWPYTFRDILSPDQIAYMLEWMYSIPSLKDQIEKKGHHFILVRKEAEFVGYASYELNYKNSGNTKLHKIYVLPEMQKTGAGQALMDEVVNRTAEAGNKNLLLNVNRENPAIGFYRKNGFEIVQTEDIDIGNGFYMNDYVMRKPISNV
jgi:ribosomal protein S18 acetylase RimI-like enzyme